MKGLSAVVVVIVLAIMGGCSAVFMAAGGQPPAQTCIPAGSNVEVDANVVQVGVAAGDLPAAVGDYKGEQVAIAAQIVAAGEARGLDAHAITLAVMTGMGESSLTNVAHGDAARNDTIGVFQEGPERGPYETRMNPAGAAGIFYDYLLERAPNYRELEPTAAAHKTQANADSDHYRPFWAPAVQMVAALSGVKDLTTVLANATALPCPAGVEQAAVVTGEWTAPAIGPLRSPFGYRIHPIYGTRKLHGGDDIGAPCAAPIYAASAGTIAQAGPAQGFGNLIVVDHGGGVQTYYGHMFPNGILVGVGRSVDVGTQIARVGTAGDSTACHLHFEVRINGERVDPVPFLAQRGVTL